MSLIPKRIPKLLKPYFLVYPIFDPADVTLPETKRAFPRKTESGFWKYQRDLERFLFLGFVRVPEMIPWMFGCGNGGTVDTSMFGGQWMYVNVVFFPLKSRCDWCQKGHILERSAWCVKLPSTTRRNGSRFPSSAQGPSYPRDLVIKLVHTWHIVEENSPPSMCRFRRWSRFFHQRTKDGRVLTLIPRTLAAAAVF